MSPPSAAPVMAAGTGVPEVVLGLAFAARTGVPVLAITSLSVHDQPIGATPETALRSMRHGGGLDGLMLENWWVAG